MPFTLYHLGPSLGLGLPLRKYVHAPTFILANVIVDVEPFLVLVWSEIFSTWIFTYVPTSFFFRSCCRLCYVPS